MACRRQVIGDIEQSAKPVAVFIAPSSDVGSTPTASTIHAYRDSLSDTCPSLRVSCGPWGWPEFMNLPAVPDPVPLLPALPKGVITLLMGTFPIQQAPFSSR